jgi:cyclic pyranopterin phosphate synthase
MRRIPYLRICVTERCGLSCFYCRPGGEACRAVNGQEMSVDQIYKIVSILSGYGLSQIKITGGEPLLRNDIPEMIKKISSVKGIKNIELVTRSPRAGSLSKELVYSGLNCLNYSLDTLNPKTFLEITKTGNLLKLFDSIDLSYNSGAKIKFNMVVMRGINDHEIFNMIDFAGKYNATLKLLDLMDMPQDPLFFKKHYFSFDGITEELNKLCLNKTIRTTPGGLGTPMTTFKMPNNSTVMIKDSRTGTWYGDICKGCEYFKCQDALMALRLTSDGFLQKCLLRSDNLVDLLSVTGNGSSEELIDRIIMEALSTYQQSSYYENGWQCNLD